MADTTEADAMRLQRARALIDCKVIANQLTALRDDIHRARVREKYTPTKRQRAERYLTLDELIQIRAHLRDHLWAEQERIQLLTSLITAADRVATRPVRRDLQPNLTR